MYLAGHKVPIANLKLLDEMIATRAELAETVGCGSYSEYKAISASLAQDPGGVNLMFRTFHFKLEFELHFVLKPV